MPSRPGYNELEPKTDYAYGKTLNAFFREFFAVTLLILLTGRASSVDMFTPSLVLFLILITIRVPYINSNAFIFEKLCLEEWRMATFSGPISNGSLSYDLIHGIIVLAAQVLGAVTAAALRVYFDVTFGTEVMSTAPGISPELTVNVSGLKLFDSFWDTGPRVARLSAEGYKNGTVIGMIPLSASQDLGITGVGFVTWYLLEDMAYTLMLSVCFVHIWLGAGAANRTPRSISNPFDTSFWQMLFYMCLMLTLIFQALYRAFPTAHGGLHVSVFKYQYAAWNPNVRTYDTDNNEIVWRIIGQLIGVALAVIYNKILIYTEKEHPGEDRNFIFTLVWGLDPDPNDSRQGRLTTTSRKQQYVRETEDGDSTTTRFGCSRAGCEKACVCRRDFRLKLPGGLDHFR